MKARSKRERESTFVPFEAEPGEVGEDGLLGLPDGALEVGVLDAEHEASPLGAREEVVEERGAGAADVEVAGGRRREADADGAGAAVGAGGGADGEGPAEVEVAEGARGRVREEAHAQPRRPRQQRARRHLTLSEDCEDEATKWERMMDRGRVGLGVGGPDETASGIADRG